MTWLVISQFLRRVASNPVFQYVAGAIAVALVIYGIYTKGFWDGEVSKDAEYQIVIQKERTRLTEEKNKAVRDAARRIDELAKEIIERDALLDEIRDATDGLDGVILSPDSVRLLNRID